MSPSISVVVAVLNEEGNIRPLYERLIPILEKHGSGHEIIYIDDGSTDSTPEKVRELQKADPCVKFLTFSRNYGHQAALTAGLDHARMDVVITMDGDLQHPPEVIPQFLEKWGEGFDIVHGVKTGTGGQGWFKSTTSGLYYAVLRKIAGIRVIPGASDYRLLSRKAAEAVHSMRECSRYLRGMVTWVGFKDTRLEFEVPARASGRPKYSMRRSLHLGWSGILSFSSVPLRVSTSIGLAVGFLCAVYAVYALYVHLVEHMAIEGWTSLMVVVLFLGSVQLVAIGLLGEYIARIFDEVKGRPLYVVRERAGFEEPKESR